MRLTRRLPGQTGEEGLVIVFFALIVTALMMFVAFSVDLGAAFNERRQDQSAADAGVLGGAQQVATGSRQAMGARAVEMARANLDTTYTDAEWSAIWASCDDVAALAITHVVTVGGAPTECVSFDTSNTLLRVRLPSQLVETAFATVAGVDAIPVHASAVARIYPPGAGGLLPFGVLGGATDGVQLCLRSGPTGLAEDPCTGSQQGNFGTVKSPHFGNVELGTTTRCQVNESYHTPHNLALGIDHLVLPHPDGSSTGADRTDQCFNFGVTMVDTDTGFSGDRVYQGLIGSGTFGSKGVPARLRQGDGPWRSIVDEGMSLPVDNQPLWEFIDDDPSGTPASCDRDEFPSDGQTSPDGTAQLVKCLTDYLSGGHDGELFGETDSNGEYTILTSPRLGFVPQFWSDTWPSGTSEWKRIKAVRPIFLQGLYFKSGNEWAVFEPGEGTADLGIVQDGTYRKLSLQQVTGFLLPDVSMPSEIIENGPDGAFGPYQIRLWR